jgi:O-antigen/teichoic acid export membrane protein
MKWVGFSRFGVARQITDVRYFALALVAQKGLPILALPWIVNIFGRGTYADYVLLYTVVQIYANVSVAAVPQAILPLWYRQKDPVGFAANAHAFVAAVSLVLGGLIWLLARTAEASGWRSPIGIPLPAAAIATVCYAYLYNVNQLGLAVARARDRGDRYMWSAVAAGLVLLGGLALAETAGATKLVDLLGVQMVALFAAGVILVDREMLRGSLRKAARTELRILMRQSVPMSGYALVVLLVMTIDKWVARISFPSPTFSAYVIDYQSAFTMMFVPVAVNLHNGARISALTAGGDHEGLRREVRSARLVCSVGAIAVAIAMALYASITNLRLTPGYWMLAAGFLLESNYMISSNQVMAQLRAAQLLKTAVGGLALYAAILALAALSHSVTLLYAATPAYFGLMLMQLTWRLKD